MSLRDHPFQSVYSSDEHSLIHDFYVPALRVATTYDRAVGFFSSASLSLAAQGLGGLVENSGRMRLLVGFPLDLEDYEAVKKGERIKEILGVIDQEVSEGFSESFDELAQNRFELLSWLISSGRLEIKIALRPIGMFHEKVGIISDGTDTLVFHGSANETRFALLPEYNYESVTLYRSWVPEIFEHYGRPFVEKFQQLWANKVKNVFVIDCPSETYERIRKKGEKDLKPDCTKELLILDQQSRVSTANLNPSLPKVLNGERYELKQHQTNALEAWRVSGFRGMFALATGAGKTITAIHAAVKVFEHFKRLFLVIAVPYQNLADQWKENLALFNINPILCYQSRLKWDDQLFDAVQSYRQGVVDFVVVVAVNNTLYSEEFRQRIAPLEDPSKFSTMFIGDECHHHDASDISSSLPDFHFRIGLSATPYRSELTTHLKKYYGSIISSYGLGDALSDGVLTPYEYYVIPISLTDDEMQLYEELTGKIGQMIASNDGVPDFSNPVLAGLFAKRSRLIGSCSEKLVALERNLQGSGKPRRHTIFYCGDGYVEVEDHENSRIKQIHLLSQLLHKCGWKTTRFTAEEGLQERRVILEEFRAGLVDGLVAIRVLDEGIDIPACKEAYLLASGRNPRQFIQRRGRILRKSPGKTKSVIYDFIVAPPRDYDLSKAALALVADEVERIREFSYYCLNPSSGREVALAHFSHWNIDETDLIGE
ncbi:MAG: DEAD/DEAH box helicase family protein [Parvibaculum sp.]|nr:DEAD/DEAH box helicase family protein [Parvibaculum sp.]